MKTRSDKQLEIKWHFIVSIFSIALLIRFIYLIDTLNYPNFNVPIIDSYTYHKTAHSLVNGMYMKGDLFWQPIFYQLYLAFVYLISGSSIVFAKVTQSILGAITCVLTFSLGERLFDRKTGILAAILTAFYGPLIFFELELLATGWATFWSVLLILLFLKTARERKVLFCFLLGICGALSILTRPTFLLFFAAGNIWLSVIFIRNERRKDYLKGISALIIGFILTVSPVAFLNLSETGHFGFLPASGGINLYIGNNPEYVKTVTTRPGLEWRYLTLMPERNGVHGLWESHRFFLGKVKEYSVTYPFSFLKRLLHKAQQFISSREIPRNVDIYVFQKWSIVQRILIWKIGSFGFPFGVLCVLGTFGVVSFFKKIPVPVILFLLLYPLSVIVVFVSARYRTPIVPVMAVLAAAGLFKLYDLFRKQQWKHIVVTISCGMIVIPAISIPGPFEEERVDYETELYLCVGSTLSKYKQSKEALEYFRDALKRNPDDPTAVYYIGRELGTIGQFDYGIKFLKKSISMNPYYDTVYNDLANIYTVMGRDDEAIQNYKKALKLNPFFDLANINIASMLKKRGDLEEARAYYQKAIGCNPHISLPHEALGKILVDSGDKEGAAYHFQEAIRINPDAQISCYNLARLRALQNRPEEAAGLYKKVLQINPDFPEAHANLADILAGMGKYDDSIIHYREALRLRPEWEVPQQKLSLILNMSKKNR